MRSELTPLIVLLATALAAGPGAAALVDMLLAEVDGRTLAASDVALARGLGVFGLEPSGAPITPADVERLVEARLVVAEARRLGLAPSAEAVEREWQATAERMGGIKVLDGWLAQVGVERGWARRLVEEELLRHELFDIRFRSFALIDEADIDAALGPPPHDVEARERVRARLTSRAAEQALTQWIAAARDRARIRILVVEGQTVALPFAMPAAGAPSSPGP